ncbi:Methyltransferase type 11 [Penicillium expansum]|uniref:Methyltransferase type 11 n=1 Tax=Penicillium expansum TaxID=27334 RepID=A0A0A2JF40_PENEN|nr:Methyltransferase type 11 [Penicillium expansum]KGO39963.1 Methyltransferase type 11 [Penicillium expansum]KGO44125.1 Methyltransferase type 11 [Penicillium expansum]KGO53273.1 Methyltransferase type 11 [Penicillium expansum]
MSEAINNHRIKDDIKQAYDEIAEVYLNWTKPSHEIRLSYLDLMLRSLDSAKENRQISILELGCGAGVPCTELLASREHISVTANDISETQIAMAKKRLPQSVNLIQGDMMELEFNRENFNAVMAMYSIFHLPRDEQTTILRRIFDWLKPGGQLLANFPETGFTSSSDKSWLGGTKGAMHWSGWGRDEMRRLLTEIGFEIQIDEVVVDCEEKNGASLSVPFHWILAKK